MCKAVEPSSEPLECRLLQQSSRHAAPPVAEGCQSRQHSLLEPAGRRLVRRRAQEETLSRETSLLCRCWKYKQGEKNQPRSRLEEHSTPSTGIIQPTAQHHTAHKARIPERLLLQEYSTHQPSVAWPPQESTVTFPQSIRRAPIVRMGCCRLLTLFLSCCSTSAGLPLPCRFSPSLG